MTAMPRLSPAVSAGALLVALIVILSGCASSSAEEGTSSEQLSFAMPPGTDDPDAVHQMGRVSELVAEATELEVSTERPADYMAVVEAVRNGFVDVALMSPFSTALASGNGSVDPLLVWTAEQEPASYCLVRSDSKIKTVNDFAGHQIAFVDPGSTTGYFMPKSLLTEHGLVDGRDYQSTFAGSHDSAILAMINGSVDMACTARQLYPTLVESGLFAEDQVRIVAESDPIPVGVAIVVNKELPADVRQRIIERLPELIMADEELNKTLLGGSTDYIAEPGDEVFAPLIKVAENVGVSLEDMR